MPVTVRLPPTITSPVVIVPVDTLPVVIILVEIKSTGVCHSQLHQMNNAETSRPISLGHEGTGYVEKVGKNVKNLVQDKFPIEALVADTAPVAVIVVPFTSPSAL